MSRNNLSISDVPIYVWILVFTLLLAQSTWLFIDAGRRGRSRWFWGIWGLLHFPTPLLVYYVWYKWIKKR